MSRTSVTSAMPCAARFSEPAQMTSSALRERSARPCSPSAQRSASARLLLPDPLGPTTALIPGPNSTFVRSANDLKPWSRRAQAGAARRRRPRSAARSCAGVRRRCRPPSTPGSGRAGGRSPGRPRRSRRPGATALADAQQLAVDPDLDPERASRGRARSRRRAGTTGRSPVRRWVYSWSRLLGLLSAPIGASASSSGSARPTSQSRTGVEPEVEVEGARDRLEGRGQERRAGAGRCAALRPRRAAGTSRGRCGRPAGRARSSRRWPRGGRQVALVVARDGGRTAPRRWPG